MRSRETFFRSRELKRESRMLPAHLYNLTTILRYRSGEPALFIPIRSLLYAGSKVVAQPRIRSGLHVYPMKS
jgi:hypothetical protein